MLTLSHIFTLLITSLLLCAQSVSASSNASDWAALSIPSQGKPQSIGKYTNGCIGGAASLPLEGEGYQVMRLSRNRYYGHPQLIHFIQQLGSNAARQQLGALLIGDLGQPRGGPTLSGHRSHQTGLDVDIWFLLSDIASQRLLSHQERESWSAPAVVNLANDAIIHSKWSAQHAKVLELAAQQPEVDRIFVNASIKRELCAHEPATAALWLRKIRPWYKHEDHFHVRLKCPAASPLCDDQEPLPAGDGCDASLAWWFTAEAKQPAKVTTPAPPPPLPWQCEQILME